MDASHNIFFESLEDPLIPSLQSMPMLEISADGKISPPVPKTSLQHLHKAKNALADGYKRDKNPLKNSWGRIADAKKHLDAISPNAKEYPEAQQLLKEIRLRKQEIEKVSSTLVQRFMKKQREMLIDELEFVYLAKGFDAHIRLNGPEKTHLSMECQPLCEVFIVKMVRDTDFLTILERAGFRKITMGDGEEFTWIHYFEK